MEAEIKPYSNIKEVNWIITDQLESIEPWKAVLPIEQTYDFNLIWAGMPPCPNMESERQWRLHMLHECLRTRSPTNDARVLIVTAEEKATILEWIGRPQENRSLTEMREAFAMSPMSVLMRKHQIPREALFGFTNSCIIFDDTLYPIRLSNCDYWLRLLTAKAHKSERGWRLVP